MFDTLVVQKPTETNPVTTTAYRLETALHCLNTLIVEQGYEFPEAVAKTIESFAVNDAQ
jgi:hypothetical protein